MSTPTAAQRALHVAGVSITRRFVEVRPVENVSAASGAAEDPRGPARAALVALGVCAPFWIGLYLLVL